MRTINATNPKLLIYTQRIYKRSNALGPFTSITLSSVNKTTCYLRSLNTPLNYKILRKSKKTNCLMEELKISLKSVHFMYLLTIININFTETVSDEVWLNQ